MSFLPWRNSTASGRRPTPLGLAHTSRFSTGRQFRLSLDKVVEHRKAQAYSHNPVVWPAVKKTGVCVNVSISNTCTTVNSGTGRRPGIVMDSSGCYPAAGRQIPGRPNDRVVWIHLCFPVFHCFVRRFSEPADRSKTGTCEQGLRPRNHWDRRSKHRTFAKFKKIEWPCEHIARALPRGLKWARNNEGPWSWSFFSFTVDPPLLLTKYTQWC
jgi:hypothetical protein